MENKIIFDEGKLYRMRRWEEQNKTKKDYGSEYYKVFINDSLDKLGLTINDDVEKFYLDCKSEGLLRGRSVEVVACICIYIVCRLKGLAYSLSEIGSICNVNKKEANKLFKVIKKKFSLNIPVVRTDEYLVRYCDEMGLDKSVKDYALELLDKNVDLDNGRNPLGLVGAVIYKACLECGDSFTQLEVSEYVGVSVITIRKRLNELESL